MEERGQTSQVRSAFTTAMTPGSIFVEAPFASDVKLACEDFAGYQGRFKNISVLSMNDAVSLLCHRPPDLGIRDGSWVRIRRGEYAKDLAYLYCLEDDMERKSQRTRGIACVRLIPRLHMKRKRGAARPTKKFFDPDLWYHSNIPVQPIMDVPGRWKFRGAFYQGGLLELRVPVNALNLGIATPSRSELQLWATCPDQSIAKTAQHSLKILAEEFWVDDRVEVMKGDQLGRLGIVRRVDEKELSVLLRTECLSYEAAQELKVNFIEIAIEPSHVRKFFEVGDYVVAVSDEDEELSGFVVAVDLMDEVSQRIKVTVVKHGSYQVRSRCSYVDLDLIYASPFSSPGIPASFICEIDRTSYCETSPQITHTQRPSHQMRSDSSYGLVLVTSLGLM